ncbi:MAG TPA: protein kinase [Burkholderiales bacterium]|jgi:serine/threonine protein kinase|nr:protein kinase [Burkholderiales bacterium]
MSDAAYPDALPSQYRLHWYVLDRVLGQGGFGITYLARDTNLDQAVAIKEYLPVDVATRRADSTVRPRSDDQAERYRWGLDRFIREARTLARFDHPNIVRVLSVFEQNSTAYMVMRFEEGENFAALLDRRHTVSEDELMRVLLPVLDGLKLVHDAGFIHRDIKPDNIHIRADGSPVLLDFGSARLSHGHAHTVTILVAPGYAPFEQYYSSGEDQGPWTDIYSLGATCYRAISGAAPMDAIARSKGILGSTRELLVPASAVGAGRYSERLLKAIDHALAFAEKDRPATIDAWRAELPDSATPPPAAAKPRAPARPASAPTLVVGEPQTPVARTAALIAAVAAVAVIGGGAGAYLMMRGKQAAEPPPPPVAAINQTPTVPTVAPPQSPPVPSAVPNAPVEPPAPAPVVATQPSPATAPEPALPVVKPPKDQKKQLVRTKGASSVHKPEAGTKIEPPQPPSPPDCSAGGEIAVYNCYRELASRGNALAALKVGELYETGRGVGQSNNLAYVWYAIAENRGAGGAGPKKDAVAARLQPVELKQAREQAQSYVRQAK